MIPLSNATAAIVVVLCVAAMMFVRAQEPGASSHRPGAGARQPQPTPPPTEGGLEPMPPPPAPSASDRPAGDLNTEGLSPEAVRSFREFPPSLSTDDAETPEPEETTAPGARPHRPPVARRPQRPEYVVEPPDLILVEVLEALPGRPISGERLVRPDGRVSLGFYGELPVAGLTLPEIKERIVLHLRKFIADDILGLVDLDPATGERRRDAAGRLVVRNPRETDRVFVDVTAYNSQHGYVLGEVPYPGSLPYTGGDTVLDLLQYAGGLLPTADRSRIRLIRSFPKGSPARVLPINYEEIAMGTDSSTNYAILPNDRLVIPRAESGRAEAGADRGASTGRNPGQDAGATRASGSRISPSVEGNLYFDRRAYVPDQNPGAELERRIDELEKKLDRLIELVGKDSAQPGGGPEGRSAAQVANPPRNQPDQARVPKPEPMRGPSGTDRPPNGNPAGPRRPVPMEPRPSAGRPPRLGRPVGSPSDSRPPAAGIPPQPEPRPDVPAPDPIPEP